MLSRETGFPVWLFIRDVYLNVIFKVVCMSLIVPSFLELIKPEGLRGFILSAGGCVVWTCMVIVMLGLTKDERGWLVVRLFKNTDK